MVLSSRNALLGSVSPMLSPPPLQPPSPAPKEMQFFGICLSPLLPSFPLSSTIHLIRSPLVDQSLLWCQRGLQCQWFQNVGVSQDSSYRFSLPVSSSTVLGNAMGTPDSINLTLTHFCPRPHLHLCSWHHQIFSPLDLEPQSLLILLPVPQPAIYQ